jgi:hypothetical protein
VVLRKFFSKLEFAKEFAKEDYEATCEEWGRKPQKIKWKKNGDYIACSQDLSWVMYNIRKVDIER